MSLISEILNTLLDFEIRYKGVCVNILGMPKFSDTNRKTLSSSIYKLKHRGLLDRTREGYRITKEGKEYLKIKKESLRNFNFPVLHNTCKDLLVIFDIPENQKTERDWFRLQLKRLGFVMIQRSVWAGPSPLPKDFLAYIKEIGIKDTFKTFKLSKPYRSN